MKEVKGSNGETELQTPEHMPVGPARIAGVSDRERLAWAMRTIDLVLMRVGVLEEQVGSLQMAAPRGIPTLADKLNEGSPLADRLKALGLRGTTREQDERKGPK